MLNPSIIIIQYVYYWHNDQYTCTLKINNYYLSTWSLSLSKLLNSQYALSEPTSIRGGCPWKMKDKVNWEDNEKGALLGRKGHQEQRSLESLLLIYLLIWFCGLSKKMSKS